MGPSGGVEEAVEYTVEWAKACRRMPQYNISEYLKCEREYAPYFRMSLINKQRTSAGQQIFLGTERKKHV